MKLSRLLWTVLLAGSALAVTSEAALADSGIIRNAGNKHWYQRFDTSMDWYQAKAFCEKRGGYLATITTATENNFVWTNLAAQSPNNGGIWLGATNDRTSAATGNYEWITGEKWSYTNWNTGEPNNAVVVQGGSENYLMMFPTSYGFNGTWNDIAVYNQGTAWPEYRTMSTICEWGDKSSWSF